MQKTNILRKTAFGLLMGLVWVLGVQGVVEGLTLEEVSEISQSKRKGSSFEMTFSVVLTRDTIAYNSQRKRVSDHNTEVERFRIDSAGYKVFDASNGREYRLSEAANTGNLFVGPQPSYKTET